MPDTHTRAGRLRLLAYVILSVAVAIALYQVNLGVSHNSQVIKQLDRERAIRQKQFSDAILQICLSTNEIQERLKSFVAGEARSGLAQDALLIKEHKMSPAVYKVAVTLVRKELKEFDTSFRTLDCQKIVKKTSKG